MLRLLGWNLPDLVTVYTLAQLYNVKGDVSQIARQGSGSACRSLEGGFVRWHMGSLPDGSDSIATQVAPESHWPEMRVIILVVRILTCNEIIFTQYLISSPHIFSFKFLIGQWQEKESKQYIWHAANSWDKWTLEAPDYVLCSSKSEGYWKGDKWALVEKGCNHERRAGHIRPTIIM